MNLQISCWRITTVFLLLGSFAAYGVATVWASTASIDTTVKVSICGNNVKEGGEQCDNGDLNGQTCSTLDYEGGTLSCSSDCSFDTSECIAPPPSSDDGGGGGGGGGDDDDDEAEVRISGKAYPGETVTLLQDARIIATTQASQDATFSMRVSDLELGGYIFSVYSEDINGERSSLKTFPVSVTEDSSVDISGVFLAPTLTTDKREVRRGNNLVIFGQSTPESNISITINSEHQIFANATADDDGIYLYNLDTSLLETGDHLTRSRSIHDEDISPFSKSVNFSVGTRDVYRETTETGLIGDVNEDGNVNLIDFSILAYWYNRPSPPDIADLKRDGQVDLTDFSIMAFHWTG
ncbi:MAG: dockerin type I domain-containing protein [Candidatus Paceibacterota bacterium]